MGHRERFQRTMHYGRPDRVPYFEEGVRPEVVEAWRHQGLPPGADLSEMFPTDPTEEIAPDMDPYPELTRWPTTREGLKDLERSLDPLDPRRLPPEWPKRVRALKTEDTVRMLRVHQGFFLSMGVSDWDRLLWLMHAIVRNPALVHEVMGCWGEFSARMAEHVLSGVEIDAAIFSEPIGGNDGPLISPQMYEDFVLRSYQPVLDVLQQHGVRTIIFRTYANARLLIPNILRFGFNCLWACEVNIQAMDYRELRQEFGRELRLIGGIDLDALRSGTEAIRREIEEKVPPLLADGGYVPLADGRVREDVPFQHYMYYRQLLKHIIDDASRSS